MSDEAAFLAALKANPADDTTRLVYADWLDEHGEPAKAEYLRLVATLARTNEDLTPHPDANRFFTFAEDVLETWRKEVGSRFAIVLVSYEDQERYSVVQAMRTALGIGEPEAWEASGNLPYRLHSWITYETALRILSGLRVLTSVAFVAILSAEKDAPYLITYELRLARLILNPRAPVAIRDRAERESQRALRDFLVTALKWHQEYAAQSAAAHQLVVQDRLSASEAHARLQELATQIPRDPAGAWSVEITLKQVLGTKDNL